MDRLVYSPSVKCWVKSDFGVIDLSPYITDCKIERKINDISKLEVVFRNPKVLQGGKPRFLFTERVQSDGNVGPVFHPMDPITVILERIAGRPIQAFTGYCDAVPYVQLFPGVTRITASCTLKRLEYTYWDPALKFVKDFMQEYGWILDANGTVKRGGSGNEKPSKESIDVLNTIKTTNLNDGSIGHLLYAILNEVGGWNNKNIYIQPLPKNINSIVANLFDQNMKDNEKVNEEVAKFIRDIIGNGQFGNAVVSSGGGGGGAITNTLDNSWDAPAMTYSGGSYGVEHLNNLLNSAPQNGHVNNDRHIVDQAAKNNQVPFAILWATYGAESSWGGAASWFGLTGAHGASGTSGNFASDADESAKTWKRLYIQANHRNPSYVAPTTVSGTPSGTKTFQGKPVAAWIVPILEWAQQHGWNGQITSGYRTPQHNEEVGGSPSSNHLGTTYPRGAIDVGGWGARAEGQQLWDVIKNYPGSPKLVWGGPTIGDWGHFSADGH